MPATRTVIPGLRYNDAVAAIAWLEKAFGFERRAVYMNPDGTVGHAELAFGSGMIMLGSAQNPTASRDFTATPSETGGRMSHTVYLVVEDCEAVYRSAKDAGAEMVIDFETKEYGGSGFTCRDSEGYVWSVGSYDPWQQAPQPPA